VYKSELWFDIEHLFESRNERELFVHFLYTQLGKPYDYTGVLSTLLPNLKRDWSHPKSWYCSEVFAAALLHCKEQGDPKLQSLQYGCSIPRLYKMLVETLL
jgi:hypothetical protein